jgi:CheY-like chemotaxis protein
MLNLVGNAIKFTEAGHVLVEISCTTPAGTDSTPCAVEISVHDTGVGIPPEKQPLLFGEFTQLDSSPSRKHEGSGLGLAISDQLVKLMGGRLKVRSSVGDGSTFTVELPLRPAPADDAGPEAPPAELNEVRILIVDPNQRRRASLAEQCSAWGMEVREVASGAEALKLIEPADRAAGAIDLVLVDRSLPDISSEELVGRIRRWEELATVPILLLTSMGERGDASRFRRAGCDGYLVHPVRETTLREALRCLAGGRGNPEKRDMVTVHTLKESRLARTPYPSLEFSGRQALLAEDNLINQKVGAALLKKLGFQVDLAADGLEALAAVAGNGYDVILMDCQMPRMDGFEATRRIREDGGRNKGVPIIAMTAHAMESDQEKCLEAGMNGYVSKPVRSDLLRQVLKKHVKRAE